MSNIEPYEDAKDAFFAEFEKMRPDLVHKDTWDSQQKEEAANLLKPSRVKMGLLASIPMTCMGMDCLYAPTAPLIHDGEPTGTACPVETAAVTQFFWDYVDELGVDVERLVEVSIVRDLVDQEIQMMRASIRLGQEDFVQENVVGMDPDGKPILKKELHLAIDYQDRILKRKEKARSQLLATRQDKVKAGQAMADKATVLSAMFEEVRKEENRRKKAIKAKLKDMDIIDAELVGEDDYDDEDE